jgi:hypothetical protein
MHPTHIVTVTSGDTFEGIADDTIEKFLRGEGAQVSDAEQPAFNSKLEHLLLSRYGDLEAVWGPERASLQQLLLKLPPYAMEVLLASNKLKGFGFMV